jgi:hypothetical protein
MTTASGPHPYVLEAPRGRSWSWKRLRSVVNLDAYVPDDASAGPTLRRLIRHAAV